jgi:hypothetical protein
MFSEFGCILVNSHFLLIYCSFCYYEVTFFVSSVLGLNSTLSDISSALLPFLGLINMVNLLLPFHPKTLFLSIRWFSYKQQIVRSTFLIHFANWCLLMRELSPFAFSVNIERYVVISAIWLFLLFKDFCVYCQFCCTLWELVCSSFVV